MRAGSRGINAWTIIAILVAAAAALFLLLPDHAPHMLGLLPYLLLAACPLIHIFMHGGHGRHGGGPGPRAD